jgi:hypothetical protein
MDKKFYEKYPLLSPDEPPPGRFVDRGWQGPATADSWRTRHGIAEVYWQRGYPHGAWNVLTPSGREDVTSTGSRWRRKGPGQPRWISGKIEISPDDVVFRDEPPPKFPYNPKGLERALANNRQFIAELRDLRFAQAVHSSLRGHEFIHVDTQEVWACTGENAAYMIEELGDSGDAGEDFERGPYHHLRGEPSDDRICIERFFLKKIQELYDAAITIKDVPQDELAALRHCLSMDRAELPETHKLWKMARFPLGHELYENIDVYDRVAAYIQEASWLRNDISATQHRLEHFNPSPLIALMKRTGRWF